MKKTLGIILLMLMIVFITSCAPNQKDVEISSEIEEKPQPAVSTTSIQSIYLNTEYPDAISIRNQLAYGIIKLAGTSNTVTPEQAGLLLPLWQAVIALSGDETTATEELTAVQNQISENLTTSQLIAIADLEITNTELNEFYAENGVVMSTPEAGVTRVPGKGKDLSEEARQETRVANEAAGVEPGSGKGQVAKNLLFSLVVDYLEGIISG